MESSIQKRPRKLKLWLSVIALLCFSGCHYFYDQVGEEKRIPVPVPTEFPFEIEGKIYRIWCGTHLQIKTDKHTAYLLLQGVGDLQLGDETERKAIEFMYSLIEAERVTAIVCKLDERKRSIAQVYSGDTHFNLEMIKNGWGRFDGTAFDESEAATSEAFQHAEQHAKKWKLGIWRAEIPIDGENG